METWATVALVLGSNIIIALSTFFATKIQVSHTDKRFGVEKALERERLQEERRERIQERKREVKGEPLLKLRAELALMSTKNDNLIRYLELKHTKVGTTDEKAREFLEHATEEFLRHAADDWNSYVNSGSFDQASFMLDDKEILDKVQQIGDKLEQVRSNYIKARDEPMLWQERSGDELMNLRQDIKDEVRKIQSLINKRLEEL